MVKVILEKKKSETLFNRPFVHSKIVLPYRSGSALLYPAF